MPDAPTPTSASPSIAWEEPGHAELTWEWDDMHTPRALTRLSAAYLRILAAGMNHPDRNGGQPIRMHVGVIDGYAYFARSVDAPETERPAVDAAAVAYRRGQIDTVAAWWRDEVRPELIRIYREMDTLPRPGASGVELAAAWDRAWGHAARAWELHFLVIDGPYQVLDDLVDAVKAEVDGLAEGDILSLASGAIDDVARVDVELDRLAVQAGRNDGLAARLAAAPPASLEDLRMIRGGDTFVDALATFLEAHGHLGHVTEDLSEPSWNGDPSQLLAEIGRRIGRDTEPTRIRRERRESAAADVTGRIRATLADRPDALAEFERLRAAACAIGWLTEGHNYWIDRMCADRLRRFTRRIGARLVELEVIDDPEDIRHFERDEVVAVLREPGDRRALVAERRAEHERWSATTPPRYLGKPPAPQDPATADRFDGPRFGTFERGVLRGAGASAGIVRGVARVVHGPADFERVQPGDIVVARASNPGWVPLFTIAGGFVTDVGGVLSHAAVVAREFGVPAVVGTGDATVRIEDGSIVEIDGTTGYVRMA